MLLSKPSLESRSALRRKDWPAAAEHFTLAVSLNPLHVESWFSLGYAYVKAEQPEQALKVGLGGWDTGV